MAFPKIQPVAAPQQQASPNLAALYLKGLELNRQAQSAEFEQQKFEQLKIQQDRTFGLDKQRVAVQQGTLSLKQDQADFEQQALEQRNNILKNSGQLGQKFDPGSKSEAFANMGSQLILAGDDKAGRAMLTVADFYQDLDKTASKEEQDRIDDDTSQAGKLLALKNLDQKTLKNMHPAVQAIVAQFEPEIGPDGKLGAKEGAQMDIARQIGELGKRDSVGLAQVLDPQGNPLGTIDKNDRSAFKAATDAGNSVVGGTINAASGKEFGTATQRWKQAEAVAEFKSMGFVFRNIMGLIDKSPGAVGFSGALAQGLQTVTEQTKQVVRLFVPEGKDTTSGVEGLDYDWGKLPGVDATGTAHAVLRSNIYDLAYTFMASVKGQTGRALSDTDIKRALDMLTAGNVKAMKGVLQDWAGRAFDQAKNKYEALNEKEFPISQTDFMGEFAPRNVIIDEARKAILPTAQGGGGKDEALVRQRLQKMGIDPNLLDQ